ncbi:MAG TPA: lysylphosphatidylglycerol synthase transmembrane domain-containing protein [Acidimicrobiales bacterium]|nr:lysylphosphatidylglycerol synthase transmembrane domain-containing protein [Acidimicrobiales bacterium]
MTDPTDPTDPPDPAGAKGTRSFEAQFEEQQSTPFPWKAVLKRTIVVVIAGVALYLVAPSVIAVLHAWPRLATLNLIWLFVALASQGAHFACTIALQRIALRTRQWFPVVTAQLAGNAISLIVPGGAAAGAAVQFRMLAFSGMDAADAAGGLTAFSLLGIAGLLALPVLVLPVVLFGAPVSSGLFTAAIIGAVAFVLFTGLAALVTATDAPLRWIGKVVEKARNRLARKRKPIAGLGDRLLEQRDLVFAVLGRQWWQATLLSAGRLGFDYFSLLAAVLAVGSHASPPLVLLAYAVAGAIGLIPITPGGLGIVEASLSGLLVLAGLNTGEAVLATLTYRLASYWIPLASGPVAYTLFKRRYRPVDPLVR